MKLDMLDNEFNKIVHEIAMSKCLVDDDHAQQFTLYHSHKSKYIIRDMIDREYYDLSNLYLEMIMNSE